MLFDDEGCFNETEAVGRNTTISTSWSERRRSPANRKGSSLSGNKPPVAREREALTRRQVPSSNNANSGRAVILSHAVLQLGQ